MQESAILMMLDRQLSFLMMSFKWRHVNLSGPSCYELKSLGLDKRTTLVLSNIRKLNRVPSTE